MEKRVLIFISLMLLSVASWAAGTKNVAGRVFQTIGAPAYAVTDDGKQRVLKKNAPVYEGETVVTGKRSISKVRFNDGALFMLRPNTLFKVEEFSYTKDGAKPKSAYNMLKGGMRFISGLISKKRGGNFSVKTPTATIGVRGTVVNIGTNQEGDIEIGVESGEADVTTADGQTRSVGSGQSVKVNKNGKSSPVKNGLPISLMRDPVGQADMQRDQESADKQIKGIKGERSVETGEAGEVSNTPSISANSATGGSSNINSGSPSSPSEVPPQTGVGL